MNETFTDWLKANWEKNNLCPPPLKSDKAMDFLVDYLIPKDTILTTMPLSGEQMNVECLSYILEKYSYRYRVEVGRGGPIDRLRVFIDNLIGKFTTAYALAQT